jgi:hypothetical protein
MACCGDNWIVPGANPNNVPSGVESVGAGTANVTITGTPSNPVVNSTANNGVVTVEGVAGVINLNGVGMTIAGATPTPQDVTFTAAVQNVTAGTGITVTNPTPGTFQVAASGSSGAPVIQKIVNALTINPVAQTSGAQSIVPIANPPGITFASLGINPSLYNFIEVSMGFTAQADINSNVWTFYALANDGSIGASYGDCSYIAFAGQPLPYYARFTMSKAAGHFTNSSTTFNMIKDDSIGPFPNGFVLYSYPTLQMGVRAFN